MTRWGWRSVPASVTNVPGWNSRALVNTVFVANASLRKMLLYKGVYIDVFSDSRHICICTIVYMVYDILSRWRNKTGFLRFVPIAVQQEVSVIACAETSGCASGRRTSEGTLTDQWRDSVIFMADSKDDLHLVLGVWNFTHNCMSLILSNYVTQTPQKMFLRSLGWEPRTSTATPSVPSWDELQLEVGGNLLEVAVYKNC